VHCRDFFMSRANLTATTQKDQILKMKKSCQFAGTTQKRSDLKNKFWLNSFLKFYFRKRTQKNQTNPCHKHGVAPSDTGLKNTGGKAAPGLPLSPLLLLVTLVDLG
jgi:hypothetical protein